MPCLGNLVTCALIVMIYLQVVAADLKVPSSLEADIGSSTTLRCRLEGRYRWYVLTWYRRNADGSEETIVNLPSGYKTTEWGQNVNYELRSRIRPRITVENEVKELNLVLEDVQCSDRGEYVCMLISQQKKKEVLQLSVKVEPLRPSIHDLFVIIEMNSSRIVECQAKVGYPPKRLIWLKKPKDYGQFKVVQNNMPMTETRVNECDVTVVQPLEIFAHTITTKMVYRCAYEGEEFKSNTFDDVSVQLEATFEVKPATVRHDCMSSGSCAMEAIDVGYTVRSSSERSRSYLFIICFCPVIMSIL